MEKKAIFEAVIEQLRAELQRKLDFAREAARGATDQEVRSEGKYDTRATEASYLARGQARQAEEIMEDLRVLEEFELPDSCGVARPGALIEVSLEGERLAFFILPRAGGFELRRGEMNVTVITPSTPIGQSLTGKFRGDRFAPRPGSAEGQVLEIY